MSVPRHDEDADDVPDNFSGLHNAERDVASRVAAEAATFERNRVKYLMTRLKVPKQEQLAIGREHQLVTGRWDLKFAHFNNHYPTFPFLLGASTLRQLYVPHGSDPKHAYVTPVNYHLHRDGYSTEPARFKKFHWVPFAEAYRQFYEANAVAARGHRLCLVFPRKSFANGMCIHNDDGEGFWESGLCWVYKIPDTGNRLYVQPFSNLVEAIYANGRGWKPTR